MVAGNVPYYDALADVYPYFFRDFHGNMQAEGDWLESVLRVYHAHRVLDASCGTGRQAIPLAERGFDVTAADPSSAMLEEACRMAEARSVTLRLRNDGFDTLPGSVTDRFDTVIALGNGLCNLDRRGDIVRALVSMRECCLSNGVCLVGVKDFAAIKACRPRFHAHIPLRGNGEQAIVVEEWEYADPLLLVTARCVRAGVGGTTVKTARTREYMLEAAELCRLAHEAGFARVSRLDHPSEAVFALTPG